MKTHFLYIFITFIFISNIISCKKIKTPNEESKQIFGTWNYLYNSGGFGGGGGSKRFPEDSWVQITETGYFNINVGSNNISKRKFCIKLKKSIYTSDLKPALVYKKGAYETFKIYNDTLSLSDEYFDGYSYVFVRD